MKAGRALVAVGLATGMLIGGASIGVAQDPTPPPPPPITNNQEAITVLNNAQADIERVKKYLATATPTTSETPPSTTTPPTTTPPPTTPPPIVTSTTPPPPTGSGTEAATQFNWGKPLTGSDEFNYVGAPGPQWSQAGECWSGHAGNGKRCASRSTVDGTKLVQTGLTNGDSAWLASKVEKKYGRWEARVRSNATSPNNGRQYHPLLLIWPTSNRWPEDGEYDFLENGAPGAACAEAFIHYPHPPGAVQQEFAKETNCGAAFTEWHNVAFEWTPEHVKGFIDGKEWFRYSGGAGSGGRSAIQNMPSGHLTIQLDNFFGTNMQSAKYEVDWVRLYN